MNVPGLASTQSRSGGRPANKGRSSLHSGAEGRINRAFPIVVTRTVVKRHAVSRGLRHLRSHVERKQADFFLARRHIGGASYRRIKTHFWNDQRQHRYLFSILRLPRCTLPFSLSLSSFLDYSYQFEELSASSKGMFRLCGTGWGTYGIAVGSALDKQIFFQVGRFWAP